MYFLAFVSTKLWRCDWRPRCPTACDALPSGRKQSIRLLACKGVTIRTGLSTGSGHCSSCRQLRVDSSARSQMNMAQVEPAKQSMTVRYRLQEKLRRLLRLLTLKHCGKSAAKSVWN